MIVAVDFDGTLVENAFPEIGAPKEDVISFVRALHQAGAKIILWTCRNQQHLADAIAYCNLMGIPYDEVNENLPEIKNLYGGDTRKVYADYYLDDKNISLTNMEELTEVMKCHI